ncbi:hypothetical protein K2173_000626 [Erythroxylum novogranatense]|uniref:RPA-interacting protein C-terminal domain-containing protein n=1 Tax=Erythroxylum novogranatense TaxID=1862640 RepID=A0AAV8S833_9ROSI|nr:hypothetical protein K2173_000626 [Erythroxylum novogranatense]
MDDQRPTPTRPCLKTKTHFNNFPSWKHKLREICCKRVREDRSRLLWKLRLPATAKSLDDKIHAVPKNYTGTWEDEEDEYLALAVFEHMHLNNEQAIWCPICKQGELKDDHKLIYCTQCELQLSKGDEVNLDILKSRLAEAHAEHLDRGCRLKPEFCIKNMFGLTALYIFCQGCNMLEVVI